jgi:chromosome segregation ATPase
VSDYPNERDCEHGHKRGKCVACDLIESESRVRELEATLAARTESLEAALASRAALEKELNDYKDGAQAEAFHGDEARDQLAKAESERDTLRAECDRLRGLVREAVAGMAKIADHGKGFTDEQMHLRIYAATYYRWAKDEAADLVARLGAE